MPTYTAPGVYIEEVASSQKVLSAAPTAVAAFVGFTATWPKDDPTDPDGLAPRRITSWLDFEKLYGGFSEGCMLPLSVYGFFANGGQFAYICRVPHTVPANKPAVAELPAALKALKSPVKVTSVEKDADIRVEVTKDDDPKGGAEGPATFTLTVFEEDQEVESFSGLRFEEGDDNVATKVNTSTKIKIDLKLDKSVDTSEMLAYVEPGSYDLKKAEPTFTPPKPRDFAGSEARREGIDGLAIAEDVTMVLVPDLVTAARREDGTINEALWTSVQTALISHCEQNGNRMAVLDAPPHLGPTEVEEWRKAGMYDSAYATMYYPWIKVDNPTSTSSDSSILIPPSGHVAGVWARTDDTRGVWKAPANDTLRGVIDVERDITQREQASLNPIGVNCIRPFGTRGIRIWGARTMSSDTDWNYINVRRLFNMVETTILTGTQWAVFEPNNVQLWEGVNRTVSGFLRGLWSAGALFGASADEAFYVKCDAETNTQTTIDQGLLIVEVGIAPVKPAEFVVFRISQKKQSPA